MLNVDCPEHDMFSLCACRFQASLKIFHNLLGLRGNIALAHDLALGGNGILHPDVNSFSGIGRDHDLRKCRILVHPLRIDVLNRSVLLSYIIPLLISN